jgi:hypothetical protein
MSAKPKKKDVTKMTKVGDTKTAINLTVPPSKTKEGRLSPAGASKLAKSDVGAVKTKPGTATMPQRAKLEESKDEKGSQAFTKQKKQSK